MDATADHDENQRKLDRRLKSICITIEISILILLSVYERPILFSLYIAI